MNKYFTVATVVLMLALAPTAKADIIVSIGNTASSLVNGSTYLASPVLGQQTALSGPFKGNCGGDANLNCSASWIFSNIALPSDQIITGATLSLGIWDIDSAAPGPQVNSYKITGGDDLTTALNSAAETLNPSNTTPGSVNDEYDVFTLPLSSFNALAAGNTQVSLTLQGPGLGILSPGTNPPDNGAILVFSTLDIQTAAAPTPEPSALQLLLLGVGSLMLLRTWRKREKLVGAERRY